MRQVTMAIALVVLSATTMAGQGTASRSGNAPAGAKPANARKSPDAGPVIVFETGKGFFEMETYPAEAPKTVEQILGLVRRNFYNGQRIHRVEAGFLVQFGDPRSRDMSREASWGTGGSGRNIGVAEFSPKRKHVLGAVAMAAPGENAKLADSQMYIMLRAEPRLDNKLAVFGKVISGMDVVRRLVKTDVIRRATIRAEAPAAK